jgi:hypothetical protein
MKRIEKDGKFYRMRRGVLVEIPEEWVGKTTHKQTIRKRPSKLPHNQAKDARLGNFNVRHKRKEEKQEELEMKEEVNNDSEL